MANIIPFKCCHPGEGYYDKIAALPYDVYSREEARKEVEGNPLSFLNIDRPETQFPERQDMYASCVYEKANAMLEEWQEKGYFVEDAKSCYYIYSLTMDGREQTGIVACSSVDDYLNNTIRKHEFTLAEKEEDRIRHVDTCSAQTGPIFLTYRNKKEICQMVEAIKRTSPIFDFISEDGVKHVGWQVVDEQMNKEITQAFANVPFTYIADGHHRCASAVKVAMKRREENPGYTGQEEYNFFLSIIFPDNELNIMPYNRMVRDLNGLSEKEFLQKVGERFDLEPVNQMVTPSQKGTYGMFLSGQWYVLKQKECFKKTDPVGNLDVSYLQSELLEPVLGIKDPKKDARIAFAGGIRGTKYLEERCGKDMKVAFSVYPTSIDELFAVADQEKMMPPKSTWFEPKLRSGLFIHKF